QLEEDCMSDQEWRNNWYDDAKECEVFIIKVENSNLKEETIKLEPEDYSPTLRFFNNRVSGLGLLLAYFLTPEKSDDKSTQSRGVVILSETGSENCKENTNLKTDKEGDDEFWYSHNDDETVITYKGEDGCHKINEEKEVFMIIIENEDEQKEGIEVENIVPGPSE
ncbi:2489_t:CDS:2, partial [Dentiscutata heterogama]